MASWSTLVWFKDVFVLPRTQHNSRGIIFSHVLLASLVIISVKSVGCDALGNLGSSSFGRSRSQPQAQESVFKFSQNAHRDINTKAGGTFSFASYYGSHMVLQGAPKKATLWGYAPLQDKGKVVTVEISAALHKHKTEYWHNKVYTTNVVEGPTGNTCMWILQLDPMKDEGPFSIKASLSTYPAVTLQDVLFGDVWICSGQSNMQFTTDMMFNATEELDNAHLYPKIRLFVAAENTSAAPLYDLSSVEENWSLPSKETVGHSPWSYFSAVCWLYGKNIFLKLKRPIGLVESDWGGTPIEAWSSPDALRRCGVKPGLNGPSNATVLWNAMIHPLLPMTIYGAIWYQGEANVHAPNNYNCTFPAMISDWREKFHMMSQGETDPTFPFGFVQIAANAPNPNATGGFPDIRWHQTADMGYVPNERLNKVFMAVALDLRDDSSPYTPIHPRDKITVGERLAAAGLAVAYNYHQQSFQGPFPLQFVMDTGRHLWTVFFDRGIVVKSSAGYEVCCSEDGITKCEMSSMENWADAPIVKSDSESVTLSTQGCGSSQPVGLRYLWRETPCPYKKCAVYGTEQSGDLPSPPYIYMATDELKAPGSLSFASYYGDHMVLQKAPKKASIWGYAPLQAVGKNVTVEVSSAERGQAGRFAKAYYALVVKSEEFNATGVWRLQLDPTEPGGPYTIKASLGSYTPAILQDVLFGDIWLCSGQSNMVFQIYAMFNASDELKNISLFPNIRFMHVSQKTSFVPLWDLEAIMQPWTGPTKGAVSAFSAVCWLYGRHLYQKLQYPIGLIESDWGGSPVEVWSSTEALRTCGLDTASMSDFQKFNDLPVWNSSILWNAMIHPLRPMTIYGAIWYQGEANMNAPNTYNCSFPAMINDWRKNFHEASLGETDPYFPFGFVQLATDEPANNISGFPDIRWHQTADVGFVPNNRLYNVFMAVALDLPDDGSPRGPIHPRDKMTVGDRLSASGLAVAYNQYNHPFQGPVPIELVSDSVDHILLVGYDKDIVVKASKGYEVCCSKDGITKCEMSSMENWVDAPVVNSNARFVTLSTQGCGSDYVVGVRYLWRMAPCVYKKCPVYSVEADLPAPPYYNMDIRNLDLVLI